MIGRVVRKEWIDTWRDGWFRVAVAVVISLLTTALVTGAVVSSRQSRDREAAHRADRQEWLAQGARNPHSAAHFGRYAFKPSGALSFFDPGLDRHTGVAMWLEAHVQDTFRHRPAEDETALQRFAQTSAASVLQLLMPLLIILLTFGQFAREREQGTLRHLLGIGARPRDLLLGKFSAGALALAAVIAPAAAIGLTVVLLSSESAAAWRSPERLAWLTGAYLLYLLTILAISLGVSALMRTARTALLMLLALWASFCLLVPRLSADVATVIAPAPGYEVFWRAIERDIDEGFDGSGSAAERGQRLRERVLAEYGVTTTDALPVAFDALSLQDQEDFGNRVFDRHYGRLWDTFDRQARVQRLVGLLSPVTGVQGLSMGLAGTDLPHFRHFADAAEAYRRDMVRRLNAEFRDKAGAASYAYVDDGSLWNTLADFSYQPPSTAWTLRRQSAPMASTLGWFILSCGFAHWSVRRLRVD